MTALVPASRYRPPQRPLAELTMRRICERRGNLDAEGFVGAEIIERLAGPWDFRKRECCANEECRAPASPYVSLLGPSKPERPSKPETSTQAATGVETGLPKPRMTTGYMPSTAALAPTAPAAEARREPAETTGSSAQPAAQPASSGE